MASERVALAKIRKIIDAWPETAEKISHGAPTWWGGRKTFASLHDGHYDKEQGALSLWIKSTAEAQDDLVAMNPELFYVPPYVGPSGWVGVRLSGRPDWALVQGLLEEGYRAVAPKRALKQLDDG